MTIHARALLAAILAIPLLTACGPRAVGERSGLVTRVARVAPSGGGNSCKVDLVEISQPGDAPFQIRVDDPKMFELLRRAMETRQPVKIAHEAQFLTLCSDHDAGSPMATRVELSMPPEPLPAPAPSVAATRSAGPIRSGHGALRVEPLLDAPAPMPPENERRR